MTTSKNRFPARWLTPAFILATTLVLSACGGQPAPAATLPPPTTTNNVIAPAPTVHIDPPDAQEHIHLDDGSTMATEGMALQEDVLRQLFQGDFITVGLANNSVQTATLTIPTMF